jgi:hypothetical protein
MTSSAFVLLVVGRSTRFAVVERRAGTDQGDQGGGAFTARHRDCAASMSLHGDAGISGRPPISNTPGRQ